MEKIEKEIKVTRYVSNDGEEFDNEYECARHEASELGELMFKLQPRIIARPDIVISDNIRPSTFEPDYKWYIVTPMTRTDWSIIHRIEELGRCEHVEPGDSKIVFLGIGSRFNETLAVKSFDADAWMRDISDGKLSIVSLVKVVGKTAAAKK